MQQASTRRFLGGGELLVYPKRWLDIGEPQVAFGLYAIEAVAGAHRTAGGEIRCIAGSRGKAFGSDVVGRQEIAITPAYLPFTRNPCEACRPLFGPSGSQFVARLEIGEVAVGTAGKDKARIRDRHIGIGTRQTGDTQRAGEARSLGIDRHGAVQRRAVGIAAACRKVTRRCRKLSLEAAAQVPRSGQP